MSKPCHLLLAMLTTLGAGIASLQAEVSLPALLASNMVIQRDRPVSFWGWSDVGEKVTIRLGDKVVATVEGQGEKAFWKVELPPQSAGPVPDITLQGAGKELKLTNIRAGEVWLCSGQSNMVMTVGKAPWCSYGGVVDADKEIAGADHPELRIFTHVSGGAGQPMKGLWQVSSPGTVAEVSATAYFFGCELEKRLHVPVGLIVSAIGGTPSEAWTPAKIMEGDTLHATLVSQAKKTLEQFGALASEDSKREAEWKKQVIDAKAKNQPAPPSPVWKLTPVQKAQMTNARALVSPGGLYNSKIHPLTPMTLAGAIWYQGESNAHRSLYYGHYLTKLIEGWRQEFHQPLPFLIVQLANFGQPVVSDGPINCWPLVREAQEQVARNVPDCGLAAALDIGLIQNIHPTNKQEVGRRLALVALKQVYGQSLVASGPRFAGAEFQGAKARVKMDSPSPMVLKGSGSFELAGVDRKFAAATAVVVGDHLEVVAPGVNAPAAVRYAFLNGCQASLFNAEGLPALPFRSDNWEIPQEPLIK